MLGGGRSLLEIRKKLKELTLFHRDPNTVGLVQTETPVLQRSHSLEREKQAREGRVKPGT